MASASEGLLTILTELETASEMASMRIDGIESVSPGMTRQGAMSMSPPSYAFPSYTVLRIHWAMYSAMASFMALATSSSQPSSASENDAPASPVLPSIRSPTDSSTRGYQGSFSCETAPAPLTTMSRSSADSLSRYSASSTSDASMFRPQYMQYPRPSVSSMRILCPHPGQVSTMNVMLPPNTPSFNR